LLRSPDADLRVAGPEWEQFLGRSGAGLVTVNFMDAYSGYEYRAAQRRCRGVQSLEYGSTGRRWYFGSELQRHPLLHRFETWGHRLETPATVRASAGPAAGADGQECLPHAAGRRADARRQRSVPAAPAHGCALADGPMEGATGAAAPGRPASQFYPRRLISFD